MKTKKFRLFLLVMLVGWIIIPAANIAAEVLPLKLDVQADEGSNAGVLESGWQQLVDTGTFGDITVTIEAASGDLGYRDRGQSGLVELDLWRDFTYSPEGLTVTIEGLKAHSKYQISLGSYDAAVAHGTPRAADWQVNGETVMTTSWGIPAVGEYPAISLSDLRPGQIYGDQQEDGWPYESYPTEYYHYRDGEEIDYMMSAFIMSDANGVIELQSVPVGEGTYSPWLNGIVINYADAPHNPHPADGSVGVPADTVLSWTGGLDPNDPNMTHPDIKKYYIWLSSGDPEDDELVNVGEVDVTYYSITTGEFNASLQLNSTYWWAVEAGLDDGQGGVYPAGDPNNHMSETWTFQTEMTVDITQQPENQVVFEGEDALLEIVIDSNNPLSYQWFHNTTGEISPWDTAVTEVTNDPNLLVSGAQLSDEGYYYCQITDDQTGYAMHSDVVTLGIKQMKAHWTLDEAHFDYGWGDYLDQSGAGNNVWAYSYDPNFIDGVPLLGGEAVAMSEEDNRGDIEGFTPSELTGRLAVSFWVDWYGPTETSQVFIGKRLNEAGWNYDNVYWNIVGRPDGSLELESPAGAVGVAEALTDDDQWQHIAATFDGETGRIYVNGELAAEGEFAFGDGVDQRIQLGFADNGNEVFYANGAMDDVRIYNYDLSHSEIAELYYAGSNEKVCIERPEMDITGDCQVGIEDLGLFVEQWLESGLLPLE